MSSFIKASIFTLAVASLSMSVFPVAAQVTPLNGEDCAGLGIQCKTNQSAKDVAVSIRKIVNAFLILVAVIAAAALVWGGFMYITSMGQDDKIATAKKIIIYALIGLIVIGLSASITNFIVKAIGGGPADGVWFPW